MAGPSDYQKDAYLNYNWRGVTDNTTTRYLALFSVLPSDAGTGGTELDTTTGYHRIALPRDTATWNAPIAGTGSQRKVENTADVDYGTIPAGEDWTPGTTQVVGWGLYDASTGGNYRGGKLFDNPFSIEGGLGLRFLAGDLEVILSGS